MELDDILRQDTHIDTKSEEKHNAKTQPPDLRSTTYLFNAFQKWNFLGCSSMCLGSGFLVGEAKSFPTDIMASATSSIVIQMIIQMSTMSIVKMSIKSLQHTARFHRTIIKWIIFTILGICSNVVFCGVYANYIKQQELSTMYWILAWPVALNGIAYIFVLCCLAAILKCGCFNYWCRSGQPLATYNSFTVAKVDNAVTIDEINDLMKQHGLEINFTPYVWQTPNPESYSIFNTWLTQNRGQHV